MPAADDRDRNIQQLRQHGRRVEPLNSAPLLGRTWRKFGTFVAHEVGIVWQGAALKAVLQRPLAGGAKGTM